MDSVLIWILTIIAIEAGTELVVDRSPMLEGVLNWLSKNKTIANTIHCGWCFSLIVSFPFAFFVPGQFMNPVVGFAIKLLVLHRLSNLFHELFVRWLNGPRQEVILEQDD